MPTPCFLATETDEQWQWLRRFTYSTLYTCPLRGIYGHEAKVEIERGPILKDDNGYRHDPPVDRTDPRWAKVCECGYEFKDTDAWQVSGVPVFSGVYGECQIHSRMLDKPYLPGTLYNAWWLGHPESKRYKSGGPDGMILTAICPDGRAWVIDGPSKQHEGQPAWTRTGTPPLITVSPSIDTDTYHGHLNNGVFTDDCNNRKY